MLLILLFGQSILKFIFSEGEKQWWLVTVFLRRVNVSDKCRYVVDTILCCVCTDIRGGTVGPTFVLRLPYFEFIL